MIRRLSALVQAALVFCGCVVRGDACAGHASLKSAFADAFRVGAAVGTHHAMGEEPAALELVARHFNSITSENLLKWSEVHPEPSRYDFAAADRYVEFGERHGLFIVGHTLVWHNQTPDWVFRDDAGQPLSRDALLERMREHIATVVGRYKGRIHAWDVVNEAIDDEGNLRDTLWRKLIGDDYIEKAFQFAHEADPGAELYYNDYNEWHPKKRAAILRLIRSLQERGTAVAGLGLQGHWGMDYPSLPEIDAMLKDYRQLGVKLMVTELDINLLPAAERRLGADVTRNIAASKELNPYADGLPPDVAQRLADRYAELFKAFMEHKDAIDRITWGRTAYPLLFDRQLQPKAAYHAVLGAAQP
ncbi:MAG: 1,4-beta-xylanase [Planctomycetota bacterium]|nr:MAG: 1,4-beta-xylanase [Planctomycetota bacterium]